MKKVWAYKCDFCNFLTISLAVAERHLDTCKLNPTSKNCLQCKNCKNEIGNNQKLFRKCNILLKPCSRLISRNCEYYDRREDL